MLRFEDLEKNNDGRVIFRGLWGSHAYGTSTPESDRDTIGIFVVESRHYLELDPPETQVADERNDNRFYSLRNYCELAANANPNILDSLFLPEDCILATSVYWQMLVEKRKIFVSGTAAKTYCEYALGQIKKARGCNKRVHNPQPEKPPKAEEFCRFIPKESEGMPARPLSIADAGINLSRCHTAAVEWSSELFRLYDYGVNAKGIVRNGMLVCESIPKEDEHNRFIGLLLFNRNAFDAAKIKHRQYWEWHQKRNSSRWRQQESGELDYDAKNLMHTFRLLYSGSNIMTCGVPMVRFEGEKLAELRAIRAGKFSYPELVEKAQSLSEKLESLRKSSALPETADRQEINRLLLNITEKWEAEHAK